MNCFQKAFQCREITQENYFYKLFRIRYLMANKQIKIEIYTYGEYSKWEKGSKDLPVILNITDRIEAETGTEFGYILRITKGKGQKLSYRIEHPPFCDEHGKPMPDFTGEFYVNSNQYNFYLGDCIWEPADDKFGKWRFITYLGNRIVADKTLYVFRKKPEV